SDNSLPSAYKEAPPGQCPLYRTIENFIREDIHNFELLFCNIKACSNMFLAYMLMNGPTNAYLLILTARSRVQGTVAFYIILFMVQQFVGILALHLCIGHLSSHLHRSAKLLLPLAVAKRTRVVNFRTKLQLSLHIARLHTNKRYGLSYGPFGLISVAAFFKVNLHG